MFKVHLGANSSEEPVWWTNYINQIDDEYTGTQTFWLDHVYQRLKEDHLQLKNNWLTFETEQDYMFFLLKWA